MTRWLVTAAVLGTFLLGAIVYIARPEVIEGQARQVVAPIKQALAEHEAAKYEKAREEAYQAWMAKYKITPDCLNPGAALKQAECRNKEEQWQQAFERKWQQRLQAGLQPD